MDTRFVIFTAAIIAYAQALNLDFEVEDSLKVLQKLIESEKEKILEAEKNINDARNTFIKMVDERLKSLLGEYNIQRQSLNGTIKEAVSKGMLKSKKFPSFQCISNAGQETYDKLDKIKNQVSGSVQKILENNLVEVYSYRMILDGFNIYIQELFKKKQDEIVKSGKEEIIRKILAEVEGKMKLLREIVDQIDGRIKTLKFKFYEEAVDFIFLTENNYRKITRDGAGKLMLCVF